MINLENINFRIICTFVKVRRNNKKSQQEHRNAQQCALIKFFFLAILEVASHADILRGSSRVPAPQSGTVTNPRTSAWEAILEAKATITP